MDRRRVRRRGTGHGDGEEDRLDLPSRRSAVVDAAPAVGSGRFTTELTLANSSSQTGANQLEAGPVSLEVRVHDGDARGGSGRTGHHGALGSGPWTQVGSILASRGVANGWVR